jgi:hypothetical protein
MMWIELNDAEQRLAKFLAKERYKNARTKNITNSKIGPQSDELTDLNGIAAEIAWCKANNAYPDTTITDRLPQADALSLYGQAVDIKTTVYKNGHLVAAPWKTGDGVDVYCLLIGEFPRYRVAGYMSSDMLLQAHRLKNLGHGAGFAAQQKELTEDPF